MIIVSDTSPVANLILIHRLEILKDVFQEVIIPPAVDREIRELNRFSVDLKPYLSSEWIKLQEPSNITEVNTLMKELDEGESEAISLALELQADYLLIDERIGTQKALDLGIQPIGLIGVIVKAKENGLLNLVEPILFELREEAGFWISDQLINTVLKNIGER